MNKDICSITNKGNIAKNEWESDDSDILWALYSLYKKIRTILFQNLLITLFTQRYINSVKSYKYLNKSIS